MSRFTRRQALSAVGAAAGLAVVSAAPAVGSAPDRAPKTPATPHAHDASGAFDEVYLGRRIQGAPSHGGGHHDHHDGGWTVHIDGEELHLMRNADGTWISVITHYEPLSTPRAAARAAVRELQGAALVPLDLS
jgi:opacity protein-like surface antigen